MEIRKCPCPKCNSLNTRNWQRKLHLGFPELEKMFQKEFPNMEHDTYDYLFLAQICDDCQHRFITKTRVEINYAMEHDDIIEEEDVNPFRLPPAIMMSLYNKN